MFRKHIVSFSSSYEKLRKYSVEYIKKLTSTKPTNAKIGALEAVINNQKYNRTAIYLTYSNDIKNIFSSFASNKNRRAHVYNFE